MFGLPAADKLALLAAVPALEAEDRLKAGGVPDGELYDLVKLATGSTAAAAAAAYRRAEERLKAGQEPGV